MRRLKQFILGAAIGLLLTGFGAVIGGYTARALMRYKWNELAANQNQIADILMQQSCLIDSIQMQHTWLFVTPCKNHR